MVRIFVVAVLLLVSSVPAYTSETDWRWRFNDAYFGTASGAADGTDAQDKKITVSQVWYTGTYHELGIDGWTGSTGFYSTDVRAPITMMPGQSKTWTFYLWENPSWNVVLELGWGYNSPYPAFDKMEYWLTYVRAAEGISGGLVPVGTSILLNDNPQGTWEFPVYRTDDGRTGYMFELTATVIPEPSSLLALFGGLAGLGGVVLKRRR